MFLFRTFGAFKPKASPQVVFRPKASPQVIYAAPLVLFYGFFFD